MKRVVSPQFSRGQNANKALYSYRDAYYAGYSEHLFCTRTQHKHSGQTRTVNMCRFFKSTQLYITIFHHYFQNSNLRYFRRIRSEKHADVTSRLGVLSSVVTKQRVRTDFWVIRHDSETLGYTEVSSTQGLVDKLESLKSGKGLGGAGGEDLRTLFLGWLS